MSTHINIDWNLVRTNARVGSQRGRHLAGEWVLQESKESSPLDTGMLENSASVESSTNKTSVSYDTPYARRLHEHPEYNFQGKGKGKWLENTINNNHSTIVDIIIREMRGEF
jgi:hypothetical protein